MRVHVLLILLNELGKRDKMRGLPSILSPFRNEFTKFKKTIKRMLDSIPPLLGGLDGVYRLAIFGHIYID